MLFYEDLSPRGVLHLLCIVAHAVGHGERAAEVVAEVEVHLPVAEGAGMVALGIVIRSPGRAVSVHILSSPCDGEIQMSAFAARRGAAYLVWNPQLRIYRGDGVLLGMAQGAVNHRVHDAVAGGKVLHGVQRGKVADGPRPRRDALRPDVVVLRPAVAAEIVTGNSHKNYSIKFIFLNWVFSLIDIYQKL